MDGCRIFGCPAEGVDCRGTLDARDCIVEGGADDGVYVRGRATLVDCLVSGNASTGVHAAGAAAVVELHGGTITANGEFGVCAIDGAKVAVNTLLSRGHGPKTVSEENELLDWSTQLADRHGEIAGVAAELLNTQTLEQRMRAESLDE